MQGKKVAVGAIVAVVVAVVIIVIATSGSTSSNQASTPAPTTQAPKPVRAAKHRTHKPVFIHLGTIGTAQLDQRHPRPPCPSSDAVSSATGNAYCVIASTQRLNTQTQPHTGVTCPPGQYSYGTSRCSGPEPEQTTTPAQSTDASSEQAQLDCKHEEGTWAHGRCTNTNPNWWEHSKTH